MELTPELEAAIRTLGAACIEATHVQEIAGKLPDEIGRNPDVIDLVQIIDNLGNASLDFLKLFWEIRGGVVEKEEVEALKGVMTGVSKV